MAQTSMTSFFGGKKRSRDDDNDETADANDGKKNKAAAANANHIVLLTAPGASGKTSKQALQLYLELSTRCGLTVVRMDESSPVKWNKFSPSHTKNMTFVLNAVQRTRAKYPDKHILLLGHSFGCRVLCEFLNSQHNQEHPLQDVNVLNAVVCQGYPLVKSGVPETDANNVQRANHLRNLAPTTKALIVQGEQDSFLGTRGMACLQDLCDSMADTHEYVTLVPIAKCGHDVSAKAVPHVRQAIYDFCMGLQLDEHEKQESKHDDEDD